jgi:class 3 adenylate cyclase
LTDVGSTPLSTRFDPADLREIVGVYHRCVADTVGRFGSFVAKYMGDGVLIYFEIPDAPAPRAGDARHRVGCRLRRAAARDGKLLMERAERLAASAGCEFGGSPLGVKPPRTPMAGNPEFWLTVKDN